MIAFLLSLTAVIAYFMGSLNTSIIASHFIFHCDLLAFSRDNEGITRFYNRFGTKGTVILLAMEAAKTALPVLIGGWLMSTCDQTVLGKAFALFCVMMGTRFPIMLKFRGETSFIAYAVGLLFLNLWLGIITILVMAAVYFFSRYISLAAIAGALFSYFFTFITLDGEWVHRLILLCVVIVLIEYRKNIVLLIKGKEEKFIFKKDISYMFDDDY